MNDLTVIFTSNSRIEADVVRGLLEAHGLQVILLSEVLQSIFPTNVSHAGAFRLAVRPADADEARRLIDAHRGAPAGLRVVRIRDEFDSLERRIGYRFRDRGLAEHALTHRSRAHEDASGGVVDNESLEFLGDAVLGFVIADVLFQEFPTYSEGQKSKIKAALVSAPTLAQLGERLSLGDDLLLGRGEEKSGGRRKQALISDAFEAVIAAIYLDGGVDAARTFIVSQFRDLMDEVAPQRGRVGIDRLQVGAAGMAAARTIAGCPTTGCWPSSGPITGSCSRWKSGSRPRRSAARKDARKRTRSRPRHARPSTACSSSGAASSPKRLTPRTRQEDSCANSPEPDQSISIIPHALAGDSSAARARMSAPASAGSGCGSRATA